jgi:hypothetical protein
LPAARLIEQYLLQTPATHSMEPFIKIESMSTPANNAIVLRYHNSRLQLPASVDVSWLTQLMQALS